MQEKAIEEQMVAVKDVVMEPTMKTLSDDLVRSRPGPRERRTSCGKSRRWASPGCQRSVGASTPTAPCPEGTRVHTVPLEASCCLCVAPAVWRLLL